MALVAAGSALAADLPLKAPPPAVAAWNWSGFYIGGHGGYGWGRDAFTDVNDPFFGGVFPGLTLTGFDPKGFLGGVHAGANWQSGAIVAGLEGDLSFTDIKGSSSVIPTPVVTPFATTTGTAASSGTFDLLGSGRARLGYLVSPNILLYGTGGLAWTRFVQNTDLSSVTAPPPPPPIFSPGAFSSTSTPTWRFGWVAGLGVEARVLDTNWLARLEYLHYDFGNSGSFVGPPTAAVITSQSSGDLTVDVVRAGLSYKFDPDRFAVGTAGASHQTLVFKAPAPVTLPWTWSGFYLGAHGGYGWTRDPFNNLFFDDGLVALSGVDSLGALGGFQAGANWQSGSFVGGLEIDLSGTDIKGSTSNSFSGRIFGTPTQSQATQSERFDLLGSVRTRVGYLVSPSLLLYATGGPGWTRMVTGRDTTTTQLAADIPPVTSEAPNWLFGWVAGAGVETRLWDTNWLARLEYLHYDFGSGSSSQTILVGASNTVTTSGHLTSDVVRAGLSYKFGWPGMGGGPYRSSAYNAMAAMPPASAAIWSWGGFYIGGHAGYGWGRDRFSNHVATDFFLTPPLVLNGVNSQGVVGGFQAGGNWQAGSVVGGLEIDLTSGDVKGSASVAGLDGFGFAFAQKQTDRFDLLGSGRARLGYLVWPNVLLYGTGGLGWTRLEQTTTTAGFFIQTTSTPSWRFGWVAGGGGEVRLWNTNWLASSADTFSGATSNGTITGLNPSTMSHQLTADVVRAGFGYKFD